LSHSEDNICKDTLKRLRDAWPEFSSSLSSVSTHSEFNEFLNKYRGHQNESSFSVQRNDVQNRISAALLNLLNHCITKNESIESVANPSVLEKLLHEVESALNLALVFWQGSHNRNFQFRAIIDFCWISSDPILLTVVNGYEVFARVSEWGIQLSLEQDTPPFPRRASIARALSLHSFSIDTFKQNENEVELFSKLRLIQKEFCHLIDEWEHCNSILAVQQHSLRSLPAEQSQVARQLFVQISEMRNGLAQWCAQSSADLQDFVSLCSSQESLSADIRAEIAAADALILSGFQKFFLPASVSRHVYSEAVVVEFNRWVHARLKSEPDDIFSLFAKASCAAASGNSVDVSFLALKIEEKSHLWSLSADPSAAIKAFAWSYSQRDHLALSALFTSCIDAKMAPNALDGYWIQTIASIIEMPETFSCQTVESNRLLISEDLLTSFKSRAVKAIDRMSFNMNEENSKTAHYVREFFSSDSLQADC